MFYLLLLDLGRINTLASVDIDGDRNFEIYVGTDRGLYLLKDGPNSTPRKVDGILSEVLHISYYDENHLLLTLNDMAFPVVIMSNDAMDFKPLRITGRYHKAYKLGGSIFLLSETGLFVLKDDSLNLILDKAKDMTVCGIGGIRRLFASSDAVTLIVSQRRTDTLDLGSSFVVCGDTAVFAEYGAVTYMGGHPSVVYTDKGYDPHTSLDGLRLKLKGDMLSINGSFRGESRVFAIAAYNGRLYLVYGLRKLHAYPLYRPFLYANFPFVLRIGDKDVLVQDLNLINSVIVGLIPVSPGEYIVTYGQKRLSVQVNQMEGYDLSSYFLEEDPVVVSYLPSGVEIYVQLEKPSHVEVSVVGFTGKVLKHLYGGFKHHSFKLYWDGTVAGGGKAKRGVYFVRVKINGRTYNKRFVWLR
ncbi:MAG: hypothetical protein GXO39_02870 [Thermotogae bacterium]|nr:hypothetical protein [Thermotogota bacterium]